MRPFVSQKVCAVGWKHPGIEGLASWFSLTKWNRVGKWNREGFATVHVRRSTQYASDKEKEQVARRDHPVPDCNG